MIKNNLLVCGNCEVHGKKEILGELDSNGQIVITRFHKGSTKIMMAVGTVSCGNCGEGVYYRERRGDEVLSDGSKWVYREESLHITFQGTSS